MMGRIEWEGGEHEFIICSNTCSICHLEKQIEYHFENINRLMFYAFQANITYMYMYTLLQRCTFWSDEMATPPYSQHSNDVIVCVMLLIMSKFGEEFGDHILYLFYSYFFKNIFEYNLHLSYCYAYGMSFSCDEQEQLGNETGMRKKSFANSKRKEGKQNENITNEFQTFYVTRRKKKAPEMAMYWDIKTLSISTWTQRLHQFSRQ